MSETLSTRPLTMKEIEKVTDPDYLRRGLEYHDQKMVLNPARHEHKLYAEVKGSGKSNYKVTIAFEEKINAKCTCFSARRIAYCKHAIAVMVTWSKTPEAFMESEAPPFAEVLAGGKKKKASVKKGKAETREIQEKGIHAIENLLTDIASTGLSAVTRERLDLIKELAEETRNYKLVRLSASLLRFADKMTGAVDGEDFSLTRYAEDVTDILFTAKAVRKYWNEGAEDERVLEELIGKTWRKKSLPQKSSLRLVEVNYTSYTTPDYFRIDESIFFSLTDGAFYSEKQILPAHLSKREPMKMSYAGYEIQPGTTYCYPGYPPTRIAIEAVEQNPMGKEAFEAFERHAKTDWKEVLNEYQEARKDIFAPDSRPVLIKPDKVICADSGLQLRDQSGMSLTMQLNSQQTDDLCKELGNGHLDMLFGCIIPWNHTLVFDLMSVVIESGAGKRVARVYSPPGGVRSTFPTTA